VGSGRMTLGYGSEIKKGGFMDALELLAEDHKLVNELFEQLEAAEDEKEKRKIFREIKTELDTHARLEETIFYPAMKERSS
jgi:hemerythrin superfamily protein